LIERKKLLTCLWLTGKGVGGVVIMVVVLEVKKEKKRHELLFCQFLFCLLLYVLSSCLVLVRFVFGSQVCSVLRYPFHYRGLYIVMPDSHLDKISNYFNNKNNQLKN